MSVKSFAGGRLVAEERGTPTGDDRVVYLHGWGRDRHDWNVIADQMPGLVVDLPGFGSSAEPTEAMGAHEYAALLRELLEEWADGDPVTLVGHSFGGRIAVAAAVDYPDLVEAVIIAGTPLFRDGKPKPSLAMRLAKLANRVGLLSDARLEHERDKRGSVEYRQAKGIMRECFVKLVNEDYTDELRRLTQPLTMIWGIDDEAAAFSDAKRATLLVPHARLVEERDGHDVHLRCPDTFVSEIRKITAA